MASQIQTDIYDHVVSAEIWMSKVAKENTSKEDRDSAETRGRAQAGATQAAIAKMVGPQDRNARSPPHAGAVVDAEPEMGGAAAIWELEHWIDIYRYIRYSQGSNIL